jgi:DNA-directed RNA polymerase specialized sigma24 family protein
VTPKELEDAFIALFDSGEADKILSRLRAKFSGLPRDDITEMFQEACAEVVNRRNAGLDTSNVAGLVTTIARNKLVDVIRSRESEDGAYAAQMRLDAGWQHDEDYKAKVERATKYIHDIVESWDIDNYRQIMLLMLEAATDGLLLQPKDIGDRLRWKRGKSSVVKARALDRLRAQLAHDGVLTWNELLDLLPIDTDIDSDELNEDDEEYTDD